MTSLLTRAGLPSDIIPSHKSHTSTANDGNEAVVTQVLNHPCAVTWHFSPCRKRITKGGQGRFTSFTARTDRRDILRTNTSHSAPALRGYRAINERVDHFRSLVSHGIRKRFPLHQVSVPVLPLVRAGAGRRGLEAPLPDCDTTLPSVRLFDRLQLGQPPRVDRIACSACPPIPPRGAARP